MAFRDYRTHTYTHTYAQSAMQRNFDSRRRRAFGKARAEITTQPRVPLVIQGPSLFMITIREIVKNTLLLRVASVRYRHRSRRRLPRPRRTPRDCCAAKRGGSTRP